MSMLCGIQKEMYNKRGVAEMNYMVTKVEKCRKFLEDRFEGLRIDNEEEQEDNNDDDDEIGDQ